MTGIKKIPIEKQTESEKRFIIYLDSHAHIKVGLKNETLKQQSYLRRTTRLIKNSKGVANYDPYKSKYYSHNETQRWFFSSKFISGPVFVIGNSDLAIWKGKRHVQIEMRKFKKDKHLKIVYFIGFEHEDTAKIVCDSLKRYFFPEEFISSDEQKIDFSLLENCLEKSSNN